MRYILASSLAIVAMFAAIPTATAATTGSNDTRWVVKPGDTLWNISQATGDTIETIENASANVGPLDPLMPGMVLTIPGESNQPTLPIETINPETALWTVQTGQTLWKIAQSVNVPMSLIADVNHIANINHIEVGQVITIPDSHATIRTASQPMSSLPWTYESPSGANVTFHYIVANGHQIWINYSLHPNASPGVALTGLVASSQGQQSQVLSQNQSDGSTTVSFMLPNRQFDLSFILAGGGSYDEPHFTIDI